jgi:hypothetical protein
MSGPAVTGVERAVMARIPREFRRGRTLGERGRRKMEPPRGIEPLTYSLRVNCSTD